MMKPLNYKNIFRVVTEVLGRNAKCYANVALPKQSRALHMTFEHYYDAHWLALGPYFAHHRRRFLQTWNFLSEANPRRNGHVLDVGGVGPIAAYLATLGWTAAESKQDLRGPLPFEDGEFDLILCTETIEHIKDQESVHIVDLEAFNYSGIKNMLRELGRALQSDGLLLVTTPNACSLLTLSKWLHGHPLLMDPGHVREFTESELHRVAQDSGLAPVSTTVVDSWSPDPILDVEVIRSLTGLSKGFQSINHGDNIIASFRKS
jgi:SAM-dependent methyltransferase